MSLGKPEGYTDKDLEDKANRTEKPYTALPMPEYNIRRKYYEKGFEKGFAAGRKSANLSDIQVTFIDPPLPANPVPESLIDRIVLNAINIATSHYTESGVTSFLSDADAGKIADRVVKHLYDANLINMVKGE